LQSLTVTKPEVLISSNKCNQQASELAAICGYTRIIEIFIKSGDLPQNPARRHAHLSLDNQVDFDTPISLFGLFPKYVKSENSFQESDDLVDDIGQQKKEYTF